MSSQNDQTAGEELLIGPIDFVGNATNEEPLGVPSNAGEDLPPEGSIQGSPIPVDDPNAKHRRKVEISKLNFAYWLIAVSIILVVIFAAADRMWPPRDGAEPLSTITDLLKLIATTAIGYVFGRSVSGKDE